MLCLHGYPDTAWTWRKVAALLPGHRVVAPFMRGYAPTSLAEDYSIAVLAADAVALREALAADGPATLIGHDWGAGAAYAVPDGVFDRVVTIAVPPPETLLRLPPAATVRQLRASWYMAFQQLPGISERSLGRLVPALWRQWSPGYDATEELAYLRDAWPTPAHRTAALRYYRAIRPWAFPKSIETIYLHGTQDGCALPSTAIGATMIEGAGHFVQLERPEAVASYVG